MNETLAWLITNGAIVLIGFGCGCVIRDVFADWEQVDD